MGLRYFTLPASSELLGLDQPTRTEIDMKDDRQVRSLDERRAELREIFLRLKAAKDRTSRRLTGSYLTAQCTGTRATARAIDTSQAHSRVQAWALILKDALETAFAEDEPAVHVNTDYGLTLTASEMADLLKMRAMRELSLKTMWLEAKRRGIRSPTFDPEEEVKRLMEEPQPPGMEAPMGEPEPGEGGFDPGMMTEAPAALLSLCSAILAAPRSRRAASSPTVSAST